MKKVKKEKLEELEKSIGYVFNNKELLKNALTHTSYAFENHIQSNEKLEFLGDSILEFISSKYLYLKYPKLKEGEMTKVFTMIDSKGKEVYAIAKVKSLTKAHKATVESDYKIIKEAFQEKKNQEVLEKWIREKQKEIYVKIDEKWRSCSFQYPGWIK